ncbi:enoyl-CoA hydratase/isomerase family protein [Paraburkholderia oxyphila]|uniref:enoyl-CoA hydratase/isomerase family protein n=1 Tax=Paraburkholderia oxyphila TaxID=614212 RepID=UPI0005B8EADE|nr:enoyl-CoA hydratase/isomerase family protein [Paraburkholderia oxyphila]
MSDYETLRIDTSHSVMTVTLSNPPINLETDAMMADLDRLVTFLEGDLETKVVVFRSDTPGYFMAHFDIAPGPTRILPPLGAPPMHGVLHTRISHLDQVTIGELRGRARGGGSELLLALDMRFASRETALIGQPEIILGLHAGAGGTARLVQLMGRGRAFEAALSGLDYDADTAERYGWINRALPDTEIRDFVDRLARRIASFPASGIASVKSIINRTSSISSSVLSEDSVRFWREIQLPEVQERLAWMLANGGQTRGPMEDDLATNLARFPEKL